MRRRHLVSVFLLLSATCTASFAEDQKCRFPGAPAHSTVSFSDEALSTGSVATYSCERGFELLGPTRRICGDDGQWAPEGIPFCVLNVAAGKAPMQISTDQGGIPQKAIDGSTSSFYNADTCSLTAPERSPWWYVNLLEPYMVQLVRLDFGKSCCGDNQPASIVVRVGNNRPDLGTNPICNRFNGFLEEGKPLFLPCNPPMPGAFVSVHLESTNPASLSICEAFVYTDQALPIERCPQFRDQPPGSTATYNGKCYIFYNRQPQTFREASALCKSRGGTLVDESNPALQGFISWELWRRHRSDTNGQYWMGAVRDPQDRNNWKWIGGDDVSVSFWNTPGGNEDCARYDGSKGWLWSDTNCNAKLNYICQHQPKACGRPEQPPNSTMASPDFNVGSIVEYTCDDGHLLVGPPSRTCLPTGFYNEFPPVCKRIHCGLPAEISNGRYHLLNDSVGYLSQVVYSCTPGYRLAGKADLLCDVDERWNGPPPRCEVDASAVNVPAGTGNKNVFVPPSPGAGFSRPPLLPTIRPPTTPVRRPPPTVGSTDNIQEVEPYPSENEILDVNIRHNENGPNANVPSSVEEERIRDGSPRLNLGAIIALGVFGGFVFLAAIITTIVILVKRNRTTKHFRHRASPDSHTVASYDSSGSESRGGLNRYYKQAWDNLQEGGAGHGKTKRKDDEFGRNRDSAEIIVDNKRRHHHHHNHHPDGGDWRSGRANVKPKSRY
ncbi:uncharacterized protein LOC135942124 isoform X2 [Cloeon dipterum]|uniref:uncharacterized protein LOC135942124 isoform X2 n=1 Tax=Cloeon dipterum TaxID=197152 RepID=UPI0032207BDE